MLDQPFGVDGRLATNSTDGPTPDTVQGGEDGGLPILPVTGFLLGGLAVAALALMASGGGMIAGGRWRRVASER